MNQCSLSALYLITSPSSFGGTDADQTTYISSSSPTSPAETHEGEVLQLTLNYTQFDVIYQFAQSTGAHFVFTVNALTRYTNGSWDPSNFEFLLQYVAQKGYSLSAWELCMYVCL